MQSKSGHFLWRACKLLKSLLPPRWRLTIWSISQSSNSSPHIAQRNCCLAAIFSEMKGVARLRFVDVGAAEGRELTSCRRWRGAAAASAFSASSASRLSSPHRKLESRACSALSRNFLLGDSQAHSSTAARKTRRQRNIYIPKLSQPTRATLATR